MWARVRLSNGASNPHIQRTRHFLFPRLFPFPGLLTIFFFGVFLSLPRPRFPQGPGRQAARWVGGPVEVARCASVLGDGVGGVCGGMAECAALERARGEPARGMEADDGPVIDDIDEDERPPPPLRERPPLWELCAGGAREVAVRAHAAVAAADEMLALAPEHEAAMLQRAEGMLGLGRAEEALAITTDAPPSHESLYLRAEALCALCDLPRAAKMLQSALRLEPRSAKVVAAAERVGWMLEDDWATKEQVEAENWRLVVELTTVGLGRPRCEPHGTHHAMLRERRAVARMHLSQPNAAMEDVDAAVALAPRFVAARMLRAKLLTAIGRNEAAFLDYRAVHAAAPHTDNIIGLMCDAAKGALRDEAGLKVSDVRTSPGACAAPTSLAATACGARSGAPSSSPQQKPRRCLPLVRARLLRGRCS